MKPAPYWTNISKKTGTIRQVRYVVNQGCCRKENLLYS